jgi:hypothetical protein
MAMRERLVMDGVEWAEYKPSADAPGFLPHFVSRAQQAVHTAKLQEEYRVRYAKYVARLAAEAAAKAAERGGAEAAAKAKEEEPLVFANPRFAVTERWHTHGREQVMTSSQPVPLTVLQYERHGF